MTSPELPSDLTALLRSSRPAAPAALREQVRTIAARETERRPLTALLSARLPRPQARLLLVPAAAAVLLVATAGVVGIVRSGDAPGTMALEAGRDTGERAGTKETAPSAEPLDSATAAPAVPGTATQDQAIGAATDRAQRVSATLTVEVEDPEAVSRAAQEALDLTRSLGGHVVHSSVATGDQGSASLTVRVPVDKVQEAVVQLSGLGRIVSQQVTIDDLQESLDALERRERSVREQIARITARLSGASLDDETRAVLEARRRALRSELRELQRGISSTRAEASMATIQLTVLTEDALGGVSTPSRVDRTLDEAVNVLVWEAVITLAIAIVAAPVALLALAGWLGRRFYRRREEERLLAT